MRKENVILNSGDMGYCYFDMMNSGLIRKYKLSQIPDLKLELSSEDDYMLRLLNKHLGGLKLSSEDGHLPHYRNQKQICFWFEDDRIQQNCWVELNILKILVKNEIVEGDILDYINYIYGFNFTVLCEGDWYE